MLAQYLKSSKLTIELETDECKIKLKENDMMVDAVGINKDEYNFETISMLRFHVGTTCIELTLVNYGFKFEER